MHSLLLLQSLTFWVLSDPHLDEQDPGSRDFFVACVADADRDAPDWAFALVLGDLVEGQACPTLFEGLFWRDTLEASGHRPAEFYPLAGNHDASRAGLGWFARYVDPLGTTPGQSHVKNAERPYPVEGTPERYSFQVGNATFLMLSDENGGGPPFGRDCAGGGGYPAGRTSRETFDWWARALVERKEGIVITCSHQSVHDTVLWSSLGEGFAQRIHGAQSWADERGSSMVYVIGDETVDGLGPDQRPRYGGELRPYGYRATLAEHPRSVALWLSGHSHLGLFPGREVDGRRDTAFVDGTWFVNAGALSRVHGPPRAQFSRFVTLTEGSDVALVRTYVHAGDWESRGFQPEAELEITLRAPFTLTPEARKPSSEAK